MLRDAVYLADILAASEDLLEFISAASFETFCANKTLRYAILHALTVIGEASSKVSAELREHYAEVPWQRVAAVRHRIVHDYSRLDYELLWQIATIFAPELQKSVAAIFRAEFPNLADTWRGQGEHPEGS